VTDEGRSGPKGEATETLVGIPCSLDADSLRAESHAEAGSSDAAELRSLIEPALQVGRTDVSFACVDAPDGRPSPGASGPLLERFVRGVLTARGIRKGGPSAAPCSLTRLAPLRRSVVKDSVGLTTCPDFGAAGLQTLHPCPTFPPDTCSKASADEVEPDPRALGR